MTIKHWMFVILTGILALSVFSLGLFLLKAHTGDPNMQFLVFINMIMIGAYGQKKICNIKYFQ